MFSKLGIFSLIAGFVIGVFSLISSFMVQDSFWEGLTLSSISEDAADSVVTAFSNETVQNALDTLFYDVPLGGVLIGLGVIFFIIALFAKET